jgi:hypothetical protein
MSSKRNRVTGRIVTATWALIFSATAGAKLLSLPFNGEISVLSDPVFGFSNLVVIPAIATAELYIAYAAVWLPVGVASFLTLNFAVLAMAYRAIRPLVDPLYFCPCIGKLYDWIPLERWLIDGILVGLLVYMIISAVVIMLRAIPKVEVAATEGR